MPLPKVQARWYRIKSPKPTRCPARLTDQRPQPVHNRFIKELFSDRHANSFTILFVADVLHPVDVLAVE